MRPLSMSKPRRRLYMAGKIPPKAHPCLYGHVGPYTPRPDITAWMERLGMGNVPQGDCVCGSTVTLPEASR